MINQACVMPGPVGMRRESSAAVRSASTARDCPTTWSNVGAALTADLADRLGATLGRAAGSWSQDVTDPSDDPVGDLLGCQLRVQHQVPPGVGRSEVQEGLADVGVEGIIEGIDPVRVDFIGPSILT